MRNRRMRGMVRAGLMGAVLCVLSPIAIPIGSVPISLGVFAVMLAGVMFGWKLSLASVCVYIALGTLGLPVFAGWKGGVSVIVGATGGYLWSYLPMSVIVSLFAARKGRAWAFVGCGLALLICYALGTAQFVAVAHQPWSAALGLCVYPFVPFDCIKLIFAAIIGRKLRDRLLRGDYRL